MTICEIRLCAADRVAAGKWRRGFFGLGAPHESSCMMGNVIRAMHLGGTDLHDYAKSAITTAEYTDVICSLGFLSADDAYAWNDAPERTPDEVIARLRDGCTP